MNKKRFWNCYFWWYPSRCEIFAHSHRVQFNNLLTGWSLTTYWILQPWSYLDNFDSAGGTARLDKNQIISIHFDLISLATRDKYYVTQIWVMWSIDLNYDKLVPGSRMNLNSKGQNRPKISSNMKVQYLEFWFFSKFHFFEIFRILDPEHFRSDPNIFEQTWITWVTWRDSQV